MNFREESQPQYANTFTIGVCSSSRLLTQYHKFCTQRAETQLSVATQSSNDNTVGVSCKCISNYCKNLCAAIADCDSALCVESSALQCQCVEFGERQWQTCFDDWLLKNYTNFAKQNDDSSARNKKSEEHKNK